MFLSRDVRKWKSSNLIKSLCEHAELHLFLIADADECAPTAVQEHCSSLTIRHYLRQSDATSALSRFPPSVIVIDQPFSYLSLLRRNWRHQFYVVPYSVFLHKTPWAYSPEVLRTIEGFFAPYGTQTEIEHLSLRLRKRIVESGLPIATELLECSKPKSSRLSIGWAPHWSIGDGGLAKGPYREHPSGTFPESVTVMEDLISRSSDIEWVFRPHPNLGKFLDRYGEAEAKQALRRILQKSNVSISTGDPTEFLCSIDALVHDSVAFLAEFALTGKPMLYLLRPNCDYATVFSSAGLRLLEHSDKCLANDEGSYSDFLATVSRTRPKSTTRLQIAKDLLEPRDPAVFREVLLSKK